VLLKLGAGREGFGDRVLQGAGACSPGGGSGLQESRGDTL